MSDCYGAASFACCECHARHAIGVFRHINPGLAQVADSVNDAVGARKRGQR